LVFIKKGGEIRLRETLATNPDFRRTVPKPNPGKEREMIKILNTEKNDSSYSQQLQHATHAYVHVPLTI
jgi:hypothetical protein